ncbi:MAG: acyl-CoA dehydrogenase, partial [Solirubrobacteraceae bacterium]
MDFSTPPEIAHLLQRIDSFIDSELVPLQEANPELFDHRREFSRTDVQRGGVPTERWHELLRRARRLAIDAGLYRYPFPR